MGASGSMQDQNRYNRMGSASGGALTDMYVKMMSTDQGGRPYNGMMNFGGAASGTQSGGGLANARVGINPPLRSDQAVRQGK